jgi:MFS family permease
LVFYGSVATLYRQASGLTVFEITLIESISLAAMLLLEIPWGYLSDRIGYKRTLVLCNFLFFLSKLIFWKADCFGAFLAERLLLSIVLSGLSGCDSAFLYLQMEDKNPKKVFSIYSVSGTAGLLLAAVTFSLFLSSNLRQTAFFTCITYAAAFLLSLFLRETGEDAGRKARRPMAFAALTKEVAGDKRFLCYLVACAFLVETNQTVTVFLSQLQYQKSGIPVQLFGYLYLLLSGVGIFALGAAPVGKRFGESKMLLLAGSACLVLYFTSVPFFSVAGILLIRISASMLYPMMEDEKNRQVRHANRATVLSGYAMLMSVIGIFTNLAFGYLTVRGIGYAMLFGGALCAVGFLLLQKAGRGRV